MAICVLTEKEGIVEQTKLEEIMELKGKTLSELKARYKEVYRVETAPSSNKIYLWRKIAYKLQEIEHGELSTNTQGKIEEFIQKYDPINNKTLRPDNFEAPKHGNKLKRDKRLPIPGTIITKEYKDNKIQVKILESGFEYNKKTYKSLSAIAKETTGAHWNGYLFFGL